MTTATKPAAKKPARKTVGKKPDYPPLPPSAKVVEIAGRDCVIVPLDDYDDWLQDAMFAVILEERLKNDQGEAAPLEEVEARLFPKKKGR